MNRARLLPLALALPLLTACGSSIPPTETEPAAVPSPTAPAAPVVDTEALKAKTQGLLDKWDCQPLDEPLTTNGAPGAFPGAPVVEATCTTGKSSSGGLPESAELTVCADAAARDASVAYRSASIGGSICLGDEWIVQNAEPLQRWVSITGCTVR